MERRCLQEAVCVRQGALNVGRRLRYRLREQEKSGTARQRLFGCAAFLYSGGEYDSNLQYEDAAD